MGASNPFFSVIVPVYKVEKYLDKCVNSVLNQTYGNFELILVDDGSPDSCPLMCDTFAAQDSRIRVTHKRNGGLSDARNVGLATMYGGLSDNQTDGYVIFMDSDDYWCDNTLLEKLHERAVAFRDEVILFGCKIIKQNGSEENTRYNYGLSDVFDKKEAFSKLMSSGNVPGSAWIMCVSRLLIERLHLRFRIGVTAEDYEWVLKLLFECNRVSAIEGIHYAYIKRDGSITTTAKLSGIIGSMNGVKVYQESKCVEKQYIVDYVCRIYLLALMSYNGLPASDKTEAKKLLSEHIIILKQGTNKYYYYIVKIFGCSISSWLVNQVYKAVR